MESMLVQEYVPGPASSHYFIDGFVSADGRIAARGSRAGGCRMYPRDFGNSTYHVTVPLEEVERRAGAPRRACSRGSDFRGIFSAEFKRDERDGELKILEVNVRPWWYVHFAATCGVNVCELAHREARGLALEPLGDLPDGRTLRPTGRGPPRVSRPAAGGRHQPAGRWLSSWLGAAGVVLQQPRPASRPAAPEAGRQRAGSAATYGRARGHAPPREPRNCGRSGSPGAPTTSGRVSSPRLRPAASTACPRTSTRSRAQAADDTACSRSARATI